MTEKQMYKLQTNEIFKKLIPPLSLNEQKQLEENIINDGCREPLCVWGTIIVDGHNRYGICSRLSIPFNIHQINFNNRDEAIAWICSNQLGRRNISNETRRYLIGKRYESEKTLGTKNPSGKNQHAENNVEGSDSQKTEPYSYPQFTANKLGIEYNLAERTIRQYGHYTKALDALVEKEPTLVNGILSGNVKISYKNIKKLAKQSQAVVKNVKNQISKNDNFVSYSKTRIAIPAKKGKVTIKDMPSYDPDAEISSLTLTIPSWISSIDRSLSTADFNKISAKAKTKLQNELENLKYTINVMLLAVEEK